MAEPLEHCLPQHTLAMNMTRCGDGAPLGYPVNPWLSCADVLKKMFLRASLK